MRAVVGDQVADERDHELEIPLRIHGYDDARGRRHGRIASQTLDTEPKGIQRFALGGGVHSGALTGTPL